MRRSGAIIGIQCLARGERRCAEVGFRSSIRHADIIFAAAARSLPSPAKAGDPVFPSAGTESRSRGVLDTPLSRVTTGSGLKLRD